MAEGREGAGRGEEILITRDSKPVARLLPLVPGVRQKQARFDPAAHLRRLRRFWKKLPAQPPTGVLLARDRDE